MTLNEISYSSTHKFEKQKTVVLLCICDAQMVLHTYTFVQAQLQMHQNKTHRVCEHATWTHRPHVRVNMLIEGSCFLRISALTGVTEHCTVLFFFLIHFKIEFIPVMAKTTVSNDPSKIIVIFTTHFLLSMLKTVMHCCCIKVLIKKKKIFWTVVYMFLTTFSLN